LPAANLLGSTVCNIALVLGITVVAASADVQIPQDVITTDLLLLAVVALVTVPVLLSGHRISRPEGGVFVATYLGYLAEMTLF
jgi:cation:H+ antiporter